MARIWTEGFELGVPNQLYQPGGFSYQWENNTVVESGSVGANIYLSAGRIDGNSLLVGGNLSGFTKYLSELLESYFRTYIYVSSTDANSYRFISFYNGTIELVKIANVVDTENKISLSVRIGGTLTSIGNYDLQTLDWKKIELYYKANATTGAYELRIDNVSIVSASNINTGSLGVNRIQFASTTVEYCKYDDIALNDTTEDGSGNISWCGDGHIVGLKPKSNGSTTDWTPEGYATAEDGTTTTNLEITAHGLATNDVIYNVTRNIYSIVTKVDDNNLTTSTIASQTQGDIIILLKFEATITAGTGTTTSLTILVGHNLLPYDVTVNTSRSNAIRRVLYTSGSSVYNSATGFVGTDYDGATVTSQAAGDSIKTFKVLPYALTNWVACSNLKPNPQYSRIKTNVSTEINLFNLEELTADKLVASNSQIRAVSLAMYMGDIGTGGSQVIPLIKSGSTTDEDSTITLPVITREYNVSYSLSPFTNAPWTRAEVDGLEAGIKLV